MSTFNSVHARPLRMRLLLLAASGLLPLVMVLAWGISHLLHEQQAQAQRAMLELSRALGTGVEAELRSIQSLLEQMSTSDELERAELHAFHQLAQRNAEQLGWRAVVLSDADGNILLRTNEAFGTSGPKPVDPDSMAIVLRTHRPLVTQVMSSPEDRLDTFAVRIPVMRGDQMVYVLSAVLPTSLIGNVIARQNIPSASVASVFDQTGRRLARSQPASSPYPSPSLKLLMDRGGTQGTGVSTTSEGVESFTGFTRLPHSGWVVAVATSVAEANRTFYALLSAIGLGLAASLGLSAVLAWLLSRHVIGPIEQLKHAAANLGRGAPVKLPPLDIEELDEVAVALTQAAAERDKAAHEREHAMEERERAAADRERLAAQITDALRMAEDANRSKDQFLAMLGHELRNPLAPISNAVQLMALKGDQGTGQERRIIERQLVHVTRLVDDLLDVSRITSGRLTLKREPVPVSEVLSQVVDTIRPSLFQRSLTLEMESGVETAWVSGDEVRLVQVFNNLLVNAIKFTPAGGSIRVHASVEAREVRIDVADSGVGMSLTDLERVFELFYQAPQSTDRARGGLGLGLPIVKSLVEMHGGRVYAASAGRDQGSCMTVWLPLCEVPAGNDQVMAPAASQGAGRVLVVDDNEDAADTCATLLEMTGYQTRVAYSPEGAQQVLREFTPDVAILDIGLPGMSGYELARELRRSGYSGRLVALTGYGQATDRAASQAAGFDAHLTKPVTPSDLLDLVGKLAATPSAESIRA